jgi:hypothetical protein
MLKFFWRQSVQIQIRKFYSKKQKLGILLGRNEDLKSAKQSTNDIMQKPNLEESESQTREYWYSDPYLLSESIRDLFDKSEKFGVEDTIDKVENLITRHRGASNSAVFGLIFNRLLQLNRPASVWKFYQIMHDRKVKPSDGGLVTLLKSLKYLQESEQEIFNRAKLLIKDLSNSPIQTNALLSLCLFGKSQNWTELGLKTVRQLVAGGKEADVTTFNYALAVCLKKRSAESMKLGSQLFDMAKKTNALNEKTVTLYLKCLLKSQLDTASEAKDLVREYLGIPTGPSQSAISNPVFKLDNEKLQLLLQLCGKFRDPALAIQWYNLCIRENLLNIDDKSRAAYIMYCVFT